MGTHARWNSFSLSLSLKMLKQQTRTIASTLRTLGLDDCFGVEPFDPAPVHELLRSWGPNEHMDLPLLTKKLITLLVLFTNRWPRDLERIGHSPTRFDEQFSKVSESDFIFRCRFLLALSVHGHRMHSSRLIYIVSSTTIFPLSN